MSEHKTVMVDDLYLREQQMTIDILRDQRDTARKSFAVLAAHLSEQYGREVDPTELEKVDLVAWYETMEDAKVTMKHARVFIQSREKMHPDGQTLYGECLTKIRQAIAQLPEKK